MGGIGLLAWGKKEGKEGLSKVLICQEIRDENMGGACT